MNNGMGETGPGKTAAIVLAGLLLLTAAGALAAYLTRAPAPAAALETVIIAANTEYVGTCPVTVAQQKGYFEAAGVKAVIQQHNSGKSSFEAAFSGKADLATTADIPIMLAGMNDVPVAVIATFFKTEHDHGIVARRDRGIDGPASLKGKTVGVTVGSSGHFVLDAFLSRQHLAGTDVTLKNLKPAEFAGAMARGEVDAIATWEPFLDNLLTQLNGNGVVFYGEEIYEIPYSLAGKRDYVMRHTELMKKVLRAMARGVHDCTNEPEASRAIMASVLKIDTSKWQSRWPTYRFKLALDQGLILALEDEARWAVSTKLVPARPMPNFLDAMYLDPMLAVAPAVVTVIH
ncbi:MAG: NrtA/SsuA/CpmA family ABC transporter substrate-binding protein [Pseudomonadota bacterium]